MEASDGGHQQVRSQLNSSGEGCPRSNQVILKDPIVLNIPPVLTHEQGFTACLCRSG